MGNILDELAAHAKRRVAENEKVLSMNELRARAEALPRGEFVFERALREGDGIHFICECKKASPDRKSVV